MTIFEFCIAQGRGLLPAEVHKAFPHKTAQQISDSLADYVKRGKMKKTLIPSAGRRYRYKAINREPVTNEKFGNSEINPAVLPLIRM